MRQTGIKNSFSTTKRYKEPSADELPFTLGKKTVTKEELNLKKHKLSSTSKLSLQKMPFNGNSLSQPTDSKMSHQTATSTKRATKQNPSL